MILKMKKLAIAGLVASLIIHLLSFAHIHFVADFILHIGVFIVFVPAIRHAQKITPKDGKRRPRFPPGVPGWCKVMTLVLFIYSFPNFAIFMGRMGEGAPKAREGGGYEISHRGDFIREINEAEYHQLMAYQSRGFSGHWMLFYSASYAMLSATGIKARNSGKASSPLEPD